MTEKDFISEEIGRLKNEGIKNFPVDFSNNFEMTELETPGKTLFMGNNIFGHYEIITSDGTPVFQFDNLSKAKYIVYSSINSSKKIQIPADEAGIKIIVGNYEKYLDSLLISIQEDFKKEFPLSQNQHSVSNEIFRKLNLVRI